MTVVFLQMLVYLFYFLPYYCMAIYGLLWPANSWMPDWALIHAGASAQVPSILIDIIATGSRVSRPHQLSMHWWCSYWILQAQFSHIGSSIHKRTPYVLRVPQSSMAQSVFWALNVFLLVLPQVLAVRCSAFPEFFLPKAKESKKAKIQWCMICVSDSLSIFCISIWWFCLVLYI